MCSLVTSQERWAALLAEMEAEATRKLLALQALAAKQGPGGQGNTRRTALLTSR